MQNLVTIVAMACTYMHKYIHVPEQQYWLVEGS